MSEEGFEPDHTEEVKDLLQHIRDPLDKDERIRLEALKCSCACCAAPGEEAEGWIKRARDFEKYIKGEEE